MFMGYSSGIDITVITFQCFDLAGSGSRMLAKFVQKFR